MKISNLFFGLNFDKFLVSVEHPACFASVRLHGLDARAFEFRPLFIRENDHVDERLYGNIHIVLNNAEIPTADLRPNVQIFVATEKLNRFLNNGVGLICCRFLGKQRRIEHKNNY